MSEWERKGMAPRILKLTPSRIRMRGRSKELARRARYSLFLPQHREVTWDQDRIVGERKREDGDIESLPSFLSFILILVNNPKSSKRNRLIAKIWDWKSCKSWDLECVLALPSIIISFTNPFPWPWFPELSRGLSFLELPSCSWSGLDSEERR